MDIYTRQICKTNKNEVNFNQVYGVYRHFQQYYSYIVTVSFIGGRNGVPGENHRPAASHWQILSHNVVSSTHKEEFFYRKCNFSRKIICENYLGIVVGLIVSGKVKLILTNFCEKG